MNTQQAYNEWSKQYDTDLNKTRDLEALALRETLAEICFEDCLEIGCGTGKNTEWLITKAKHVTAVDFSEEMLAKAKEKIHSDKVRFQQADITSGWFFVNKKFSLVSFSLVLEHIENLDAVFKETAAALAGGGHVYIGELHPFKQYSGSKARFEAGGAQQIVPCFNHNLSDFIFAAKKCGLGLIAVNEYFDENDRTTMPRVLVLVFRKKSS